MIRERRRASPGVSVYPSIQRQLEYLKSAVALAESLDPEKIDSLSLGVYAARECETCDPEFADVLFNVHYLAASIR